MAAPVAKNQRCGCTDYGNTNNLLKLNVADVGALCDVYSAQIDQARTIAPGAKAFKDGSMPS